MLQHWVLLSVTKKYKSIYTRIEVPLTTSKKDAKQDLPPKANRPLADRYMGCIVNKFEQMGGGESQVNKFEQVQVWTYGDPPRGQT